MTVPVTESEYLFRLAHEMETRGWTVDLFAFHLHPGGRVHYPHEVLGPLIEINVPEAAEALMTLAHEVGHVLGAGTVDGYHSLPTHAREAVAWARGWSVLCDLGASGVISRDQWEAFQEASDDE